MRFSSVFQLPAVSPAPVGTAREVARTELPPPPPAAAVAPPADLPDDLDARVRLVGEWQLGEAY